MTTITMNDSRIVCIAQIKEFLKVSRDVDFKTASRDEKYKWIEKILFKFRYFKLRKKDKTTLKAYMMNMTGFSDAQTTRLIAKKKKMGTIKIRAYCLKAGVCAW